MGLGRFLGPPGHHRAFVRDMQFNSDVGILPDRNGYGRITQWARWCHTIVLAFVILVAFVGSGEVMVATELLFAMLTFERQEIDEVAVLS